MIEPEATPPPMLLPFQGGDNITGDEGTQPSLGAGLNFFCSAAKSFKNAVVPHVRYFNVKPLVDPA